MFHSTNDLYVTLNTITPYWYGWAGWGSSRASDVVGMGRGISMYVCTGMYCLFVLYVCVCAFAGSC